MNHDPIQPHPAITPKRQFIALLLIAAGIQFWLILGRGQLGERRQILFMAAAAMLALLFKRPALLWCGRLACKITPMWCGRPACSSSLSSPACTSKSQPLTFIAITIFAIAYLFTTAKLQHRDFAPILHDEHAYIIQARTLASGHLWLPKHEISDHFDTFHLITDRAYAAKYGPGTALFYVPAVWAGLPLWVISLLLSGVSVGLFYLLITELFDNPTGLLAALLLLSLGIFRRTSIMVMSQAPMLFLALLAILALIWWQKCRGRHWVILMSICIGWGAITRPVDALCLAIPLLLAVLFDLRHQSKKSALQTITIGLLTIAPFLALQLIYNKGVTGHLTDLPWNYYANRDDPYDTMGRPKYDPALRPASSLPQKKIFFDDFTVPAYLKKLEQSRLTRAVDRATLTLTGPPLEEQLPTSRIYGALPHPLLLMFLPIGLLLITQRRRWVLVAALPAFILIYANYTFFLPHYAVAIAPAALILLLAGKSTIEKTFPQIPSLRPLITGLLIGASISALPELNPARKDQWFASPFLRNIDKFTASLTQPSIVLFRFDPNRGVHEEPVYNIASSWPDDAKVIRAHDLGDAANQKLLAYYKKTAPDRIVYLLDESTFIDGRGPIRLGAVRELLP